MYSKTIVLDYLWLHNRFYSQQLYRSDELYRDNKGYAALVLLFNILEIVIKSVVNSFDISFQAATKKLFEENLLSEREFGYLSGDTFSIRKIRNLFAHANLGAINFITLENDIEVLNPLTEEESCLLLYEQTSEIVFNLILKIIPNSLVSSDFYLDKEILEHPLNFKILSVEELLACKGYPKDYLDIEGIPEEAKIRLIDNTPDINMLGYILGNIAKLQNSNE